MQVEMSRMDQRRGMSAMDKLRDAGYTQFTGSTRTTENFEKGSVIIELHFTRQDLLTKKFKSTYKSPWQIQQEILFRRL